MISASRAGGRFNPVNCFLTWSFHSGMFHSCDAAHRVDKLPPTLALLNESFLTLRCQAVVTPPLLIRFFDPTAKDQASIFEPVEQRIERGNMEAQDAARALFDELSDVVTVARLILEQRENQ